MLSPDVRELVKQTLEPQQAERLLAKLDVLFRNWGIYPPSISMHRRFVEPLIRSERSTRALP